MAAGAFVMGRARVHERGDRTGVDLQRHGLLRAEWLRITLVGVKVLWLLLSAVARRQFLLRGILGM